MSADRALIGARLRSERKARRLTVDALAEAFREHASERDRRHMPKLQDLRRMIRGYEAGEHVPRDRNRMLYAAVFDMAEKKDLFGDAQACKASSWKAPEAEFNGAFNRDDEDRLTMAVRRPSRLDPQTVESLATILAEQRRLEDTIGSAPVLHVVQAQLQTLAHLVVEARGPIRPRVVEVAAQWAQFSGWLNIAVGGTAAAGKSLDRAAEHAEEIGDAAMVGTVLSWKAYLAERIGKVGPMIGLAHAAQRHRIGPGHAYDLFLEARGHALAGDPGTGDRLLGKAQEAAAAAEPADARPWEYYYLEPGFFALEAGLTHIYLGREDPRHDAQAVERLTSGLAELPAGMRRSEWAGEYIAHQATAYLQASNADAACAAVLEALDIAMLTSSESLLGKLRNVHERMMSKWPADPTVRQLRDALR